jgi:hypothetical protein
LLLVVLCSRPVEVRKCRSRTTGTEVDDGGWGRLGRPSCRGWWMPLLLLLLLCPSKAVLVRKVNDIIVVERDAVIQDH